MRVTGVAVCVCVSVCRMFVCTAHKGMKLILRSSKWVCKDQTTETFKYVYLFFKITYIIQEYDLILETNSYNAKDV